MPTALIVEDEPEANRLLSMLIQLRGYSTRSAFTGQEAIAVVEGLDPPDVVFLDLMLPDTNGFEVCRQIKSRPQSCAIPVVMVTARLVEENRARSAQVGADGFIPKPYTPNQIFDALASADAIRRSQGELAE
ncbi:MAG: response regulator with CheY-like receiver domain and winged-helix DNA-binding domain [Planctomycetota bacterium]|nr:response regulator with CheY-like receiver domain and winged-helix DNA-binding domain [Planctomycetota bacterium]